MIASGARREMRNHPGYYSNLSHNYPKDIPSPYKKQIEVDLLRTFPNDPFFDDKENLDHLQNVLMAYSRRSITIGYCQGFNFIVGRILKLFRTEEDTFWLFTQIIENLLPPNYFCELVEIMTDCTVLTKLLEANEKELVEHLNEINAEIYLNNCIYKWLMSLFITNTHELLWLAIWDIFMLEGNIVLFKAPIAIMKLALKDLLKAETAQQIQSIFTNTIQLKNDVKYLLYYLLVKQFNFDPKTINKNREKILPKVIEGIRGNKDFKVHKEKSGKCDLSWPLCVDDSNFRHEVAQFFIYKPLNPPVLIPNYCDINCNREELCKAIKSSHLVNSTSAQDIEGLNLFNQLLVERRKHLCQANTSSFKPSPKSKISNNWMPYVENHERDENEMTSLLKAISTKSDIELSPHLLSNDNANEETDPKKSS